MKTRSALAMTAIALCAVAANALVAQGQVRVSLSDGGPDGAPHDPSPIFEIAAQVDDVPPVPGTLPDDEAPAVPAPAADAGAGVIDAACGDCCTNNCLGFVVQMDVLAFSRSTENRVLFHELGTGPYPNGDPVLGVPDLGFQLGSRVAARVNNCCSYDFEFVYLGVNEWSESDSITGIPMEMSNLYGMAFNVDSAFVRYESDLNSFEANLRECLCDRITFIAGVRYVRIDEELLIADTFPTAIGPLNERMLTQTRNDIFGMQFGADILVWDCCCARVNIEGKAGMFYNRHENESSYDTDPFFLADTSGDDSDSSSTFLGELGITGAYEFAPCASLRAGYRLMWLTDVATAPGQIDSTRLNPLEPRGVDVVTDSVFYHGGFVGLEVVR